MATNVERFKKDLDRLILQGQSLEFAMRKELSTEDGFLKQVREHLGADKANELFKKLPDFRSIYEVWYSESLALLRQLLLTGLVILLATMRSPRGERKSPARTTSSRTTCKASP